MDIKNSEYQASELSAENLTTGYDEKIISAKLNVDIPKGAFTVIVGPNACGKSTLLRTLSRLLKPKSGQVVLCGKEISRYGTKEVSRKLGLLPQSSIAPEGIDVADLVGRGRYPHQGILKRNISEDIRAIQEAMATTNVLELATTPVDQLSGGQRQRVWMAMVLAQMTPLLLLDEPTTFLDISHQIELLELLSQLRTIEHRTIVAVLHDLNHASRYADHLIVMKAGEIVATGHPVDIMSANLVEQVYGLPCTIIDDPVSKTPMVIPLGSSHSLNA